LFCGYLTDRRYDGWDEVCEQRFGTHPVQVCHEWNMAVHRSEGEARPGNRPLSREELQGFFDYCDDRVGQGVGKVVHAVSRRSMGRLVLRPLCRNEVAILVCPPRRSTLIAVLRRVAMTCGPLPVRSW